MPCTDSLTASSNALLNQRTPHGNIAMTETLERKPTIQQAHIEAACQRACDAIAPAWPLDRAIAVNPHWSRIGMPLRRVAARMAVLAGMQVFPPRARQREAWECGRISAIDLELALKQVPDARASGLDAAHCLAALAHAPAVQRVPLLTDLLDDDARRDTRLSWHQAITHQVSQTCAAWFDRQQADWQPDRSAGLYAFWRQTLTHDHGIGLLMGLPGLAHALDALPVSSADAESWVFERLGLPAAVWPDYLEAVLLTVNGWASWCAYLAWQAKQQQQTDSHLRELLAIRLAWGVLLLESRSPGATQASFARLQQAWRDAPAAVAAAEGELCVDEVWQTALELGYQRTLARQLHGAAVTTSQRGGVEAQAVFCIDVRSEPLRRALEHVSPAIETRGFAGFFGLPVAYTPFATSARRPQLPGLLGPAMEVSDRIEPATASDDATRNILEAAATDARQTRLGLQQQWRATTRWPGVAFNFVEAAGLAYLGKLGQWLWPAPQARARDDLAGLPAGYQAVCRPRLTGLSLDAKLALARGVLHAMGLERDFAPLVLLVGHGSQSANNAHAAALDCGACCGQTGEVNARSLAALLNEAQVRTALRADGLSIPDSTTFVAALHNTTTDEVEGLDLDLLSGAARGHWQRMQAALAQAGDLVRRERAPLLGLRADAAPPQLLAQLRRRASDGAQTRPEWGLAGNAAFIIAPRARSLGLTLHGRTFLHDYNAECDENGSVLELLMTAPMLVTHWINWQYHASCCEPARLGSGNKVLHNVVGGSIGVFEGNGGDLRIGLSHQSLHDGARWMHEPLRLTVVVDAPRAAIEAVLAGHQAVRQLVDHRWLHLWRYEGADLVRYERGAWLPVHSEAA